MLKRKLNLIAGEAENFQALAAVTAAVPIFLFDFMGRDIKRT